MNQQSNLMEGTRAARDFKRVLHPGCAEVYTGRTDYRRPDARQGYQMAPVFLKVKYTDGRLSISGVVGPRANGDAWGACGQCLDVLEETLELAPGWDRATVRRLYKTWKRWHLNDMRADCEHQRALGWWEKRIKPEELPESRANRDERGILAGWVYKTEHKNGLLCEPCPECGYKFGSAWLREEVPADVLVFLQSLPMARVTPAWV